MIKYLLFQFRTATKNFGRNKIRTVLTSLGILIGVLSVVILIALGVGLKNYIEGQFESLGSNLLFVLPGQVLNDSGQFQGDPSDSGITFDERTVSALKRGTTADYVVPLFIRQATVEARGISKTGSIFASNEDVFVILNLEIVEGQLFTAADMAKRSKGVVVGNKLAVELYGDAGSAIGEKIVAADQRFTIIGVLKEKGGGGFGGPDFDKGIYLPYTTSFTGLNPDREFAAIYLGVSKDSDISAAKDDATKAMLVRYKKDEFSIVQQTEFLNAITSIFGIINSVLVAIGSISLVVGGIGIMNIMYANVTERTKEVGIRRAIGATKRDILFQFLAESILLSLIGGVGGLLLAVLIVAGVSQFFPLAINVTSVVVAIGISTAIGVFFGVFPARRAANLAPIEAIRFE